MTGFEPMSSRVEIDRSVIHAATTSRHEIMVSFTVAYVGQ